MTVSLEEREETLLRKIAEGDGETVNLSGLQDRDIAILRRLCDVGLIERVSLGRNGVGGFRAIQRGQAQSEGRWKNLRREDEKRHKFVLPKSSFEWLKRHAKFISTLLVASAGALWFLFSELVSSSFICPKVPNGWAQMLKKCENIPSGETK